MPIHEPVLPRILVERVGPTQLNNVSYSIYHTDPADDFNAPAQPQAPIPQNTGYDNAQNQMFVPAAGQGVPQASYGAQPGYAGNAGQQAYGQPSYGGYGQQAYGRPGYAMPAGRKPGGGIGAGGLAMGAGAGLLGGAMLGSALGDAGDHGDTYVENNYGDDGGDMGGDGGGFDGGDMGGDMGGDF